MSAAIRPRPRSRREIQAALRQQYAWRDQLRRMAAQVTSPTLRPLIFVDGHLVDQPLALPPELEIAMLEVAMAIAVLEHELAS